MNQSQKTQNNRYKIDLLKLKGNLKPFLNAAAVTNTCAHVVLSA